jgi:hypothetical protein
MLRLNNLPHAAQLCGPLLERTDLLILSLSKDAAPLSKRIATRRKEKDLEHHSRVLRQAQDEGK